MGGWAEGLACADPGARTPIGVSGIFSLSLSFSSHPAPKGENRLWNVPFLIFLLKFVRNQNEKNLYLSECLILDFKKISQKQMSANIQKFWKKIYEFLKDLKIPDMGKISMHILKFEEFCLVQYFTALWEWKIEEMVAFAGWNFCLFVDKRSTGPGPDAFIHHLHMCSFWPFYSPEFVSSLYFG
jgi:hypothetical protein